MYLLCYLKIPVSFAKMLKNPGFCYLSLSNKSLNCYNLSGQYLSYYLEVHIPGPLY